MSHEMNIEYWRPSPLQLSILQHLFIYRIHTYWCVCKLLKFWSTNLTSFILELRICFTHGLQMSVWLLSVQCMKWKKGEWNSHFEDERSYTKNWIYTDSWIKVCSQRIGPPQNTGTCFKLWKWSDEHHSSRNIRSVGVLMPEALSKTLI